MILHNNSHSVTRGKKNIIFLPESQMIDQHSAGSKKQYKQLNTGSRNQIWTFQNSLTSKNSPPARAIAR
jgi:hypothetical protein